MKSDHPQPTEPRLNLQAIHFEFTDAMEEVLREKLSVLLRHNDYIIRINLRVQQDQRMGSEHHYTATGQIEIGGPDIVATAEHKDAYNAIDLLVEKLDRQLEKRHGRRKDRRNHPHAPEIDAELPKVE